VAKRRLVIDVTDDGTTVKIGVGRFETIGGREVGPVDIYQTEVLSFPCPVNEEWQHEMVRLVLDKL